MFEAKSTADNISDEHIDSLCHPPVEGKNAPQIVPIVKKAMKSLRKQTNTSPVLDLGTTQYLFFKQAIIIQSKKNSMMTGKFKIRLVFIHF